jgi:MFS family permease
VSATPTAANQESALAVFRNRPFLLLWLAQASTQIGGNMVIFGLTVIISKSTGSTTAVSALILTFLVPAVLFSAVAGVFVDRLDRRLVLIVTNVLRGLAFLAMFFVGDNLIGIYILNVLVSTITVFFGPAEAAMIPILLPKRQLLAANGIFTLTLNAAFALGFALLGPLVVKIAGGNAEAVIFLVAVFYFIASAFCVTLPSAPPAATVDRSRVIARTTVTETEQAVESVFWQLREGLAYIRDHREIRWSLIYLGIGASLVGVLGVLGPDFAQSTLGLDPSDFVVVVLPLGVGIVMGILLLNAYGRLLPRRRVIEAGLVALGFLLAAMALSGQISSFLGRASATTGLPDLSLVTSLLSIVVAVAFFAGISYSFVAIPAQTQLQEDLPPDVRGRVYGVLNMLVSVASFLPILVVGPIADIIGTTMVLVLVALLIGVSGIASIMIRGPLKPLETQSRAEVGRRDPIAAALGAELPERSLAGDDDEEDEELVVASEARPSDETTEPSVDARRDTTEPTPNPAAGTQFSGRLEPVDLEAETATIDGLGEASGDLLRDGGAREPEEPDGDPTRRDVRS